MKKVERDAIAGAEEVLDDEVFLGMVSARFSNYRLIKAAAEEAFIQDLSGPGIDAIRRYLKATGL